jgi:hypothetical protein
MSYFCVRAANSTDLSDPEAKPSVDEATLYNYFFAKCGPIKSIRLYVRAALSAVVCIAIRPWLHVPWLDRLDHAALCFS